MDDSRESVGYLLAESGHRDKNVRNRVARELGNLTDRDARAAVFAATRSDDWRRRFAALRAMGAWPEDERPSGIQIASALADPVTSVRWAAVHALATGEQVETLQAILSRDPAPTVRAAALFWTRPQAARIAITALDDEDYRVRFAAAVLLGHHGDASAREALIRAVGDRYMWVRDLAIEALARIGGPGAVEAIIPLLRDRKRSIRLSASYALGKLGDQRAVDPLLDLLERSTTTFGKRAAVVGLGHFDDQRAVAPISRALQEVWESNPRNMGETWEDKEAFEKFALRRDATQSLLRIGGPEAIQVLVRLPADWVAYVDNIFSDQ